MITIHFVKFSSFPVFPFFILSETKQAVDFTHVKAQKITVPELVPEKIQREHLKRSNQDKRRTNRSPPAQKKKEQGKGWLDDPAIPRESKARAAEDDEGEEERERRLEKSRAAMSPVRAA